MGSDPRALLRSLVAVVVLAAAGFGLPARALSSAADHGVRLTVVKVPGLAERRLPFPATHLGLRWRGSEKAPVALRWRTADGWGPWTGLSIWDDAGDPDVQFVATGLVRPPAGATAFAVRPGPGAERIEAVLIDAGRDPAPASSPVTIRAAGAGGAPEPPVISRHDWGANEGMRKGHPEFAAISKLVVHHTVTQNDDPDPAQTVRAIYAYHTRGNGWNDIGYNFLVDQQGRVYEGRFARAYRPGEAPTGEDEGGRGVIGAHAKAVNPGTAGVALLGDYSGGFVPPGPALDSLVKLLAWKAARHNIDPKGTSPFTAVDGSRRTFPNIAGHRDVGDTGCPGGRLYDRLPEIRQRVADTIGAPPPAPPPPAPLPPPAPPIPVPEFPGFWSATSDGVIRAFGDVRAAGDLAGKRLGGPIVSLAATPAGHGYWMVGADGGVFAFGDAPFLGAPVGQLRSPAVHLEPTPSGKGYWVLSAGGEVAPFGDAAFLGQTFPLPLVAVGLASTPTARGYWIATADAKVLPFGDAVLHTLTGGPGTDAISSAAAGATRGGAGSGGAGTTTASTAPTVAIAASPDGKGYWLLARDGGVFSYGVPFHGSVPDRQPYAKAVELRATDSGAGYYVAGRDGAVFAFGDADRRRERRAGRDESVVDVAFRPSPVAGRADAGPPSTPAPIPPTTPAPAARRFSRFGEYRRR
jgi:hypothetical protein